MRNRDVALPHIVIAIALLTAALSPIEGYGAPTRPSASSPKGTSSYEDVHPTSTIATSRRAKTRAWRGVASSTPSSTCSSGSLYRIRNGDTLYSISRAFSVPVDAITKANRIDTTRPIRAGDLLKIPCRTQSRKSIQSIQKEEDETTRLHPRFRWPLPKVVEYRRDEADGVRPIGIVIKGSYGSKVLSAAKGRVSKIGWMRGFGNYIVITHDGRFATVYARLDEVFVEEGEYLNAGEIIGKIGKNENSLHFQIDCQGRPKNPLEYLPSAYVSSM